VDVPILTAFYLFVSGLMRFRDGVQNFSRRVDMLILTAFYLFVSGLMRFCNGYNKGTASNIVQLSEIDRITGFLDFLHCPEFQVQENTPCCRLDLFLCSDCG
jgi:hypothetical protein